ncbi:MAG: PA14 domain-containing protein [Verrucomicrobiota bacterium]
MMKFFWKILWKKRGISTLGMCLATVGVLAAVSIGLHVYGQVTLPYTTDFESGEGYTTGDLHGQNGWVSSGGSGAQVTTTDVSSETQGVAMGPAVPNPSMSIDIDNTGMGPVGHVDFYVKAVAQTGIMPTVVNITSDVVFGWMQEGSEAELYVFDGDGAGSGIWVATGWRVALTGQTMTNWHRITVRLDYANGLWDVYGDGLPIIFNIGFVNISPAFTQFSIHGDDTATVGLDLVSLSEVHPLFTDADLDGMADAFETANGLNPTLNDRDSDLDGDGLSNVEEYVVGSDPSLDPNDIDEDGLSDSWEIGYFGDLNQGAHSDFDADGLDNETEFAHQSDPTYDHSQRIDPKLVMTVIKAVNDTWQTVTLPQSYDSMVVVATPVYTVNENPAVVRIRNASGRSLEIKVQNPGDARTVGPVPVHLLVVEEGSYIQALHGFTFEALKVTSTFTNYQGNWKMKRRHTYAPRDLIVNPVVLGQVMTENDPLWSIFWARGSSRENPPTNNSIYLGKHVGEELETQRARLNETLGVVIFESGQWTINGMQVLAELGGDTIENLSDLTAYSVSGLSAAKVAVLSSAGMDGTDGGWPVLIPPSAVTPSQLRLGIDEDQLSNEERNHTSEQIAYLVAEFDSLDRDGDDLPDAWEQQIIDADPGDSIITLDHVIRTNDFDQDGLSNHQEYWIGSDALNASNDTHYADYIAAQKGKVNWDIWQGASTGSIDTIYHHDNMLSLPSFRHYLSATDTPNATINGYVSRMRGFILPPVTGEYRLAVNADDGAELKISTGFDPGNQTVSLTKVAFTSLHSSNTWDKYDSQISAPLFLEAGRPYLFEVWHREWGGDEYLKVGWLKPGETDIEVINSEYLVSYHPPMSDLDDDGIQDATERILGLDPIDPADGILDADSDGLNNQFEINFAGTDIHNGDTDGDGDDDTKEYFLGTDPLDASELTILAAVDVDWRLEQVGDHSVYSFAGQDENGEVVMVSSGRGMSGEDEDSFAFLCQNIVGDFDLKAKFEFNNDFAAWAGLAVRSSLETDSEGSAITAHPKYWFKEFRARRDKGDTVTTNTHDQKGHWLRLIREADTVTAYTSKNGKNWFVYATTVVDLAEEVIAGITLYSEEEQFTQFIRVSDISLEQYDIDSDGVTDAEEAAAGTNPLEADTDGDGFSDYEEIFGSFSDPTLADLTHITTVDSIDGAAYTSYEGDWRIDGDGVYNRSHAGSLNYQFDLAEGGIYRLDFSITNKGRDPARTRFEFNVHVNGIFVGSVQAFIVPNQLETAWIYLPWLDAGTQNVQLEMNHYFSFQKLAIESVQLQRIHGYDANVNGIEDWLERRLQMLNSVDEMNTSLVSPACIEGDAFITQLVSLNGVSDVSAAPDDRWYKNVVLDSRGPTPISVSFENGALRIDRTIVWESTDVYNADNITIRKGDSLLLDLWPDGASLGQSNLVITHVPEQSADPVDPITYSISASDEETQEHLFSEAGTYHLSSVLGAAAHTFTVKVVEADLGSEIAAWLGRNRDWIPATLDASSFIQADSRLEVSEKKARKNSPRNFKVTSYETTERPIVARVDSEGDILDSVAVKGFHLASSTSTFYRNLGVLEDGTEIVEMGLLLTEMIEGIEIDISIFVGGVTFDDGTISRTLTLSDFDENGQASVVFLKAPGIDTSTCHRLKIYHNGTYLGTR